MDFITIDYDKNVNRGAFDCLKHSALNHYIANQATQDQKRNVSRSFMMLDGETLIGYYTLAASSVLLTDIPEHQAKGLPRYPLPAVLLSRLAVDKNQHGGGIGKRLMADVFRRAYAISRQAGVAFIVVDAKDQEAASFYQKIQFTPSTANPLRLVMPVSLFIPTLQAEERGNFASVSKSRAVAVTDN